MPGHINRRLRRFWVRVLPGPAVADRIGPWLTLLAAVVGGGIALWQFSHQLDLTRAQRSLDLHEQMQRLYLSGTGQRLYEQLHEDTIRPIMQRGMCRFLVAEGHDIANQADCDDAHFSLGEDALKALAAYKRTSEGRLRITGFIEAELRADPAYRLDPMEGQMLLNMHHAVVQCVEEQLCDRDLSANLFLPEMIGFVNAACLTWDEGSISRNIGLQLVDFIREASARHPRIWVPSGGRFQPFFCTSLRER